MIIHQKLMSMTDKKPSRIVDPQNAPIPLSHAMLKTFLFPTYIKNCKSINLHTE